MADPPTKQCDTYCRSITCTNHHFPDEPGKACCPLHFSSPFVPNLCMISGLAKTFHIRDTVPSILLWTSHLASYTDLPSSHSAWPTDIICIFNMSESYQSLHNHLVQSQLHFWICHWVGQAYFIDIRRKWQIWSTIFSIMTLTLYRMVMPFGTPFLKEKINN